LLPREPASAADKVIELQFFELSHGGPPKKDWTDALANAMLTGANAIWAPGESFTWSKDNAEDPPDELTQLPDPQLDAGNEGDVKVPPKTSFYEYTWETLENPPGPSKHDTKNPPEVNKVCDSALSRVNSNQLPVILIQNFVATNNTIVPLFGLTLYNLPPGGKGGMANPGTPGGPGYCILIAKDAQVPPYPGAVGEVLAHELGHAMCLPHYNVAGNLMHASLPGVALVAPHQTRQQGAGMPPESYQPPNGFLCPKEIGTKVKAHVPPTPTPTPTPAPRAVGGISRDVDAGSLPAASRESGTGTAGLVAVIAGVTSGVIALGGAAWYLRRRRLT
jgi:hypothetical protein